jgi:DNA polymerase-3 subunit epsilon
MIKDSDLAGFNSDRFDIPLLAEELSVQVLIDMKTRYLLMYKPFSQNGRAYLSAAYKFYCGESLENAFSRS